MQPFRRDTVTFWDKAITHIVAVGAALPADQGRSGSDVADGQVLRRRTGSGFDGCLRRLWYLGDDGHGGQNASFTTIVAIIQRLKEDQVVGASRGGLVGEDAVLGLSGRDGEMAAYKESPGYADIDITVEVVGTIVGDVDCDGFRLTQDDCVVAERHIVGCQIDLCRCDVSYRSVVSRLLYADDGFLSVVETAIGTTASDALS